MWGSSGYRVAASKAPVEHSGSITLFYCMVDHLSLEALQLHGMNVTSFHLALGGQQWYILRRYLAPDDASTIEDVVAAHVPLS